ncbi:hypothetical protein F2P81_017554 [Scophthalmus maximus]|uniref:Uncharacterized protein n=1 Tax=Scophthalmus maximus TaxID=52904 RepID=A0A6A4S967_SCOMX|nr:hypothetical protein F2P81_017554 [Scophthalmus maximus]
MNESGVVLEHPHLTPRHAEEGNGSSSLSFFYELSPNQTDIQRFAVNEDVDATPNPLRSFRSPDGLSIHFTSVDIWRVLFFPEGESTVQHIAFIYRTDTGAHLLTFALHLSPYEHAHFKFVHECQLRYVPICGQNEDGLVVSPACHQVVVFFGKQWEMTPFVQIRRYKLE